ncbi:MAG: response regulator transcription factor [Gammaproteobacteria bacterium]|nr:response regulator transcription factor [Gammaproteobacteria bacterium]
MTHRTTLLLVDDHPVVREGLNFLLAGQPDFLVVGEAGDAPAALEAVARLHPQVVVLDLTLDGEEAIALIADLRRNHPQARILVLSMHDEMLYAERLLALGVSGYVMKQEAPGEFLRALRRVAAGDVHVSEAVSARLISRVRSGRASLASPLAQLTVRERDVIRLVAKGLGTQEIARALDMSPKTVDSHRRNVREKLGLTSARDLVRYAVRWAADQDGQGR